MKKYIIRKFSQIKQNEDGQALVETIVSIMTFLLAILGIIQLSLIFNAKFLTNYAAYCAARAAITSNNDTWNMEDAAAIALSPNYQGGFAASIVRARLAVFVGEIDVQIISGGNLDSDDRFFETANLDEALITVQVDHWYTMFIPYINNIIRVAAGGNGRYFFGQHQIHLRSTYTMRMQSDDVFND